MASRIAEGSGSGNIKELNLKRFHPEKHMKHNFTAMIFGKRRTGKSKLIKWLCYVLRNRFHAGMAVTPSSDTRMELRAFMPASCIVDDLSEEKTQKLIDLLKKHNDEQNVAEDRRFEFLKIHDDTGFEKKQWSKKSTRDIMMNGRHRGENDVWALQYCQDIPPPIRTNIDYVFIFKETRLDIRKNLHRSFCSMCDFKTFCAIMDQCTNNHECLVVDNTSVENTLSSSLYFCKASIDLPKFSLFDKVVWKIDALIEIQKQKEELKQAVMGLEAQVTECLEDEEETKKQQRGKKRKAAKMQEENDREEQPLKKRRHKEQRTVML